MVFLLDTIHAQKTQEIKSTCRERSHDERLLFLLGKRSSPHLGERLSSRPLDMRSVFESLEIAAPFEAALSGNSSENVPVTIPGDLTVHYECIVRCPAEIVPAVSPASVCNYAARSRATLGIECVLFDDGSVAPGQDDFDAMLREFILKNGKLLCECGDEPRF